MKTGRAAGRWATYNPLNEASYGRFTRGLVKLARKLIDKKIAHQGHNFPDLNEEFFQIYMYDNAITNGVVHIDEAQPSERAEQKWIVYCLGLGTTVSSTIKTRKIDCDDLHYNYIAFDYRTSRAPLSYHSYMEDGIAVVQYLLDTGVSPHNIILKGNSIGGAEAIKVAKYYQDQNVELNLYVIRTPAKFKDILSGITKNIFGYCISPLRKLSSYVLVSAGFDLDVAADYQALPDARKDYCQIAPAPVCTPFAKRDLFIHPDVSLGEAVDPEHNEQFSYRYIKPKQGSICQRLFRDKLNMHGGALSLIKTEDGISPQRLFTDFVRRVNEHDQHIQRGN